jgi:hypothetical protein
VFTSSPIFTTFLTSFPLLSFIKVVHHDFLYTILHLAARHPHYLTQGLKIHKDLDLEPRMRKEKEIRA